jgi:hypothetical protein
LAVIFAAPFFEVRRDLVGIFGESPGADSGFEAVDGAHKQHRNCKGLNLREKRLEVVFAFFKKREGVGYLPLLFGDVSAVSIASM